MRRPPPPLREIPSLDDLLEAFQATFAQHVEVEERRGVASLVRLAGYELRLPAPGEKSDTVFRKICQRLAEVAAFGLASALTDESEGGTLRRMELVVALARLEATRGPARPQQDLAEDGTELLTTAAVAAELGMSRPYVSMLCDQGKLGDVSRSEGGHRRIRRSAVDAYKRLHASGGNKEPDLPNPAARRRRSKRARNR